MNRYNLIEDNKLLDNKWIYSIKIWLIKILKKILEKLIRYAIQNRIHGNFYLAQINQSINTLLFIFTNLISKHN